MISVWFSQPSSGLKYSSIRIQHFSLILPKLLILMATSCFGIPELREADFKFTSTDP